MKKQKTDRHLASFSLAGFTYYDGAEVFGQLKVGSKLKMKAEPNNRYDARAVALYYDGRKLGFVPRNENAIISKLLNLGYTQIFQAFINRISPTEGPEAQIGVTVKIKRNE
ncbi:MAG: DNA-binding protein [Cyclobacteriaceae bacterium]|nr:DNA-binding protein [Cyclobacteriaceae bacterium]